MELVVQCVRSTGRGMLGGELLESWQGAGSEEAWESVAGKGAQEAEDREDG